MFTLEDDVTIEIGFDQKDINTLVETIAENAVWEFVAKTNTGREFKIVLMQQDEYEQRRK